MPSSSHFYRTIVVKTCRAGSLRVVASVREAGEMLLDDWPPDHCQGRTYDDATRACLIALEGKGSTEEARVAFVAAAKEAGIFVRKGS